MIYEPNQSFKARLMFLLEPVKVHIIYVLPSIYNYRKILIYKYWSKTGRYWIESMCFDNEMDIYIKVAKLKKNK